MKYSALPSDFLNPARPASFDGLNWHIFAYPAVLEVIANKKQFSTDYSALRFAHPNYAGMWAADDPRHHDLRHLVADPFRSRVVADISPALRRIALSLLGKIKDAGSHGFEVMADFARPFATQVICYLLGIELEHAPQLLSWLDELVAAPSPAQLPRQEDMVACLRALLQEQRKHPRQGLIDELIAREQQGYQVAGTSLSEWDLVGYIWTLFAAGVATTATEIGNLLLACIEAGCLEEVQADHSVITGAIEESLRWNPSFPAVRRTAVCPVQLSGTSIEPGQVVIAWISAANRDPQRFPDPDQFAIRRSPNRHLSFGHGSHSCLGAELARLQMRIAIEALLDTLGLLVIDPYAPPPRYRFGMVNQLMSAHLLFAREDSRR